MRYSIIFVLLVLLSSLRCARQTTPTGGPRDTIPPTLISSIPPNQTTNFKGRTLELTFDEAITLNNPKEQLLVTPSIGKEFELTVRKRTVTLNLNASLKDSTTYTINFRESIQDITEKNPARNLQIALSTGSYIDSLTIRGNVYRLLRGTAVENATVALYQNKDTFNIFNHTPEYLTITDKSGSFSFQNLRPGTYYIYAFNDKNRNFTVDSRSESYGFQSDSIELAPGYQPVVPLPVLSLDARDLKLISARPYNTYFNIRTSKNLDTYSLTPAQAGDSASLHYSYGENQSNVHLYLKNPSADSIGVHFRATDSLGFSLDTLLYAKLSPRTSTPEKFLVVPKTNTLTYDDFRLTAILQFNKPVIRITYDSIQYVLDSTNTFYFTPQEVTLLGQTRVVFQKPIPPDLLVTQEENLVSNDFRGGPSTDSKQLINKLIFAKSAFVSVDGDSSQNMEVPVKPLRPDNTGTILVQVHTDEPYFIVQLLNRDYTVRERAFNNHTPTFKNLTPGDYMVNMVIDKNQNNRWDAGNYFLSQQPEPVVFYRNEEGQTAINIKANWELGPLFITFPQPVENLNFHPDK